MFQAVAKQQYRFSIVRAGCMRRSFVLLVLLFEFSLAAAVVNLADGSSGPKDHKRVFIESSNETKFTVADDREYGKSGHISFIYVIYALLVLPVLYFIYHTKFSRRFLARPTMVFENILVEVLNRVLGDYVENLDSNQLNVGIWHGNVSLQNLRIKESALDDLDLPIKTKLGFIGKLDLRVPWKNLYTKPVVVKIDGLYLLATPKLAIQYDAEKSEKAIQDAKQRELQRIEAKKALEKAAKQADDANKNDKAKKNQGFVEKLVTQIIKNLQIEITNIHVRYEDRYTTPESPFSCGITLSQANFQTTDKNWTPTYVSNDDPLSLVQYIFKLVELDSLALYWNPHLHTQFGQLARNEAPEYFRSAIAIYQPPLNADVSDVRPSIVTEEEISVRKRATADYSYMLEPIYSYAHLRLNQNPELEDFKIPKIMFELTLKKLGVVLSRNQYQQLMEFLEGLEGLACRTQHMKYDPVNERPIQRSNAAAWWKFAYRCVLGETVRPHKRSWSWAHMKEHRAQMRRYRDLYRQKLILTPVDGAVATSGSTTTPAKSPLNATLQRELDELEKKLDVFNITLMRQYAEFDAEKVRRARRPSQVARKSAEKKELSAGKPRQDSKTEESLADQQPPPKQSWWQWATGQKVVVTDPVGDALDSASAIDEDTARKFREAMTEEEKQRLYAAIGYQETGVPDLEYPRGFVENEFNFILEEFYLTVRDDELAVESAKFPSNRADAVDDVVVQAVVKSLFTSVKQLPTTQSLQVDVEMGKLEVSGCIDPRKRASGKHEVQKLVSSPSESKALLHVRWETHPLDSSSDQRLNVTTSPVQLVYDAYTIDRVMYTFQPPKSVQLKQITAAAVTRFDAFRESSTAGLINTIQNHQYTEIHVNFAPSYLVLPENGELTEDGRKMILDFGSLSVRTVGGKPSEEGIDPRKSSVEDILDKTYEKYQIDLKKVQLLFVDTPKYHTARDEDDRLHAAAAGVDHEALLDWRRARIMEASPLHILSPLNFSVTVENSILAQQIKLPQVRVKAKVSPVTLNVSQRQLSSIMQVGLALPMPGATFQTPEQQKQAQKQPQSAGGAAKKGGKDSALATPDDSGTEDAATSAAGTDAIDPSAADRNNEIASRLRLQRDLNAIQNLNAAGGSNSDAESGVSVRTNSTINAAARPTASYTQQQSVLNISPDEQCKLELHFSLMSINLNIYHQEWSERRPSVIGDGGGSRRGSIQSDKSPQLGQRQQPQQQLWSSKRSPLAYINISGMKMAMDTFQSGRMKIAAQLHNFSIIDVRPGFERRINELFVPKRDSVVRPVSTTPTPSSVSEGLIIAGEKPTEMLGLEVTREGGEGGTCRVVVSVCRFQLALSTQFYMAVADFFQKAVEDGLQGSENKREQANQRIEQAQQMMSAARQQVGTAAVQQFNDIVAVAVDPKKLQSQISLSKQYQRRKSDALTNIQRDSARGTIQEEADYMTDTTSSTKTATADIAGSDIGDSASTAGGPPATPAGMPLDITVKIEEPEILLIENADDANSRVLILKSSIVAQVQILPLEGIIIKFAATNMQMYQTTFQSMSSGGGGGGGSVNASLTHSPQHAGVIGTPGSGKAIDSYISNSDYNFVQILSPIQLSALAKFSPDGAQKINVSMTDLRLRVAPSSIQIISAVLDSLTASMAPKEVADTEVVDKSHIWRAQPVYQDEHWFLQPQPEEQQAVVTLEKRHRHHRASKRETFDAANAPLNASVRKSAAAAQLQKIMQILLLDVGKISVTVDSGFGYRAMPMLMLEARIDTQVSNWSKDLYVKGYFELEVSFYNKALDVWEPLLEPVESTRSGALNRVRPWTVTFEVQRITGDDGTSSSGGSSSGGTSSGRASVTAGGGGGGENEGGAELEVSAKRTLKRFERSPSEGSMRSSSTVSDTTSTNASSSTSTESSAIVKVRMPTQTIIRVDATDELQLTVSKITIDVFNDLSASFSEAVSAAAVAAQDEEDELRFHKIAPYWVHNDTGETLTLIVTEPLVFADQKESGGGKLRHESVETVLQTGQSVPLRSRRSQVIKSSMLGRHETLTDVGQICIGVRILDRTLTVPIARAERRFFFIPNSGKSDESLGIVTDVEAKQGYKKISIRSQLQFVNQLPTPVELYVKSAPSSFYTSGKRTNAPIMLSSVDKFAAMNLPCVLMQGDASAQFCFIPGGYYSYSDPVKLTDLLHGNGQCIRVSCRGGDAQDVFYARVECEQQRVLHELTRKKTGTSVSYRIILRPVLWICNGLPYDLLVRGDMSVSKSVSLVPGNYSAVTNVPFDDGKMQVTLPNYMSCQWSGFFQLDKLIGEKAVADLPIRLNAVVSNSATDAAQQQRMPPVFMGIRRQVDRSTPILLIYSPYWIVNRTDKELSYREPEIRHPPPSSSIIQAHTNPNDKPVTQGDGAVWNKPLLFCYPPEMVRDTSKKYLSLRVEKSQWSDPFSPDAIGSNGVIMCRTTPESGRTSTSSAISGPQLYEIGIQIQSSHIVLTKIIVFTPYYMIVNKSSKFDIAIREESSRNPNAWLLVPRQQVVPFWPMSSNVKNTLQRQLISAHIMDTKELTSPFEYAVLKSSLLKLDNYYGGLWQENLINENSAICSLGEFSETASAALIVNYTNSYTVRYRQHGDTAFQQLRPQCKVHFAWSMPARVPLLLDLDIGGIGTSSPIDLSKNEPGGIPLDQNRRIYYAMFLDGIQRVLLITEDVGLALAACHATDLEPISTEILLTLDKVGFSLVNDTLRREVLYAGIVGSGSIWQFRKHGKSRFRNFSVEETRLFEEAFTKYNRNKLIAANSNSSLGSGSGSARASVSAGPGSIVAIPQTNYEVMFEAPTTKSDGRTSENMTGDMGMLIVKPSRMELRRLDQKGVWARLNLSQHQTSLHVKLQRLQIDNPQIGSQFPIVLLPTPLPNDVEMKAFFEASVIIRKFEHTQTTQIKLAQLLIQEMQVSIDQDFINGLVSIFTPEELTPIVSETKMLESFKQNDLPSMEMTLATSVAQNMGNEAPTYYDKLLLHPLKIHLSFSLSGGAAASAQGGGSQHSMNLSQQEAVARSSSASTNSQASIVEMPVEFVGLLFKSLGVTLTEVNDCVLKLGLFERDARFMTNTHLLTELQSHYTSQVLKQFYTLVLGLDVIGNPFGLVRGVSEGVKDLFYEPYKGVVEGPEEFVQGVGAGVKSLVGHTVGGTLGTAGRLTGTLGRAFASLTFDEEFQRRRRTLLNRNPNTFGEGMAYSGQYLLSGITEGVTGVFSKPMEGLRTSGAEGFFKGLGKGFIGAVARPTAGLVDFATGTLQTVRTVVAGGDTSNRLRLTRFIGSDGVIRPYNVHQAEGYQMFHELEKGAYVLTDEYIDHLITDIRKTFMLILTNRQIFFLERGDIIKNWHIQWRYHWHDLIQAPALISGSDGKREIQVLLVDEKRKSGLLKPKKSGYKVYVEVGQEEGQAFCNRAVKLWQTATASSIH